MERTIATKIYTPSAEEMDLRIARFDELEPISMIDDLTWDPRGALEICFARKMMAVILEDAKSPFGDRSPIMGANGTAMFSSVMLPGQGPCLHDHNETFETCMVLQGSIEYCVGDPIEHKRVFNQRDVFSRPPGVNREFNNVGEDYAVQLTILTGRVERDDVTMPHSVKERVTNEYDANVAETFREIMPFGPPRN